MANFNLSADQNALCILLSHANESARGNCYKAALELLHHTPAGQARLCHGIATQTVPPFARIGHAWVEELWGKKWFVRDALSPLSLFERDLYYRIGKINEADVSRYLKLEASRIVADKNHYGPWNKRVGAAFHARAR